MTYMNMEYHAVLSHLFRGNTRTVKNPRPVSFCSYICEIINAVLQREEKIGAICG